MHRRRSSVNFRGGGEHKIFARKICIKNQQNARILDDSCPKNYQNTRMFMTFARKINEIPDFCLKNIHPSPHPSPTPVAQHFDLWRPVM